MNQTRGVCRPQPKGMGDYDNSAPVLMSGNPEAIKGSPRSVVTAESERSLVIYVPATMTLKIGSVRILWMA